MNFPVDQILPKIIESLDAGRNVVLQAPPGSGKTTRVAPALLNQPWLNKKKILLLEPRRLAARSAAAYMARQAGESTGETIGYHVRLDRRISSRTRIEIITEGLLIQRLLSDPELKDIGVIIFDEFHERSLTADTSLAISLEIQQVLRTDLRIIIMSATMQPDAIARHIGNADIHTAETTLYPVETTYLSRPSTVSIQKQICGAVMSAIQNETGSILVFLPGEGEIKRSAAELETQKLPDNVEIHPLYASLPRVQQDAAIAPPRGDTRKVVLTTSVAESSLTIEGIRVVIDSGVMRVPRYSPRLGMSRLETLRITRDRADQRRGRAGRLGPGICMRLWDEITDRQLNAESLPEIMDADLSSTVLQCAEWGVTAQGDLPWMTPPPTAAWQRATGLLLSLDALGRETDDTLRITARGRTMARIPVHPRLAHMILEASEYGAAQRAAFIAAVISERGSHAKLRQFTDLGELINFIERNPNSFQARSITKLAHQWSRSFGRDNGRREIDDGSLLAWAFPDRIARRRDNRGIYLLQSGQGALIDTIEPLANEDWLVVAELHDQGANTRIRLAVAIDESQIHKLFSSHFESREITRWDKRSESVVSTSQVKLGAITIKAGTCKDPDPELIADALMDGVRSKGIDQLPWSKQSQSLRERVTLLNRAIPDQGWPIRQAQGWPDMSDQALIETLDEWLKPACAGLSRWSHVHKLDMYQVVSNYLTLQRCNTRLLDKLAPTHITVPSGSHIRISYDAEQPYLRVRIQEVFGMLATPKVADGRVPVVIHLLSPAQRPVQVTQDLKGFWASSYALVRKDMRGRYPKHYWPEDPSQAEPTRRVRPRKL